MVRGAMLSAVGLAMALSGAVPSAQAQKYGGALQVLLPGNPASLSIHDEAPSATTLSMSPVYNNLALFDPLKPVESFETIVPELAESYSWSADGCTTWL